MTRPVDDHRRTTLDLHKQLDAEMREAAYDAHIAERSPAAGYLRRWITGAIIEKLTRAGRWPPKTISTFREPAEIREKRRGPPEPAREVEAIGPNSPEWKLQAARRRAFDEFGELWSASARDDSLSTPEAIDRWCEMQRRKPDSVDITSSSAETSPIEPPREFSSDVDLEQIV